jgi:hypothetical protein
MSYILDALKKAAEQRDRQTPVLKRLLGPAPTPRSIWARSPGRLLAALMLNAGLLAVLTMIWLRPGPIATPPEPGGVAAPAASSAPQSSAPVPQRTTETGERRAAPRERTVLEPSRPEPAKAPAAPAQQAARRVPQAPAPPTRETPAVAPSATPAAPPTSPSLAGLRLEALVYADQPEKRMIFVNGHKYVEGDTIDGRLRVEEIQEDGVSLSEEGRRMTLRIAR